MSHPSTNRRNKRNGFHRNLIAVLALLPLCFASSCIVVPVPVNYHTGDSRKNVNAKDARWLIPGQRTREEVLLRLGEPDEDGNSLTYRWEKKYPQLWAVWGAGYSGGGGYADYGRDYALKLGFDATGQLERCQVQKSKLEQKASHSL